MKEIWLRAQLTTVLLYLTILAPFLPVYVEGVLRAQKKGKS